MKYTGKLFKVLDNKKSCHGGNHVWIPREWVRVEGELIPCERGIHLCREQDLLAWLGPEIWAAEYRGEEFIDHGTKVVVREARITTKYENWNETTARLLACDFAEKVVHLCEDDTRPAEAIRIIRLYAQGKVTKEELAAARAAAGEAAGETAGEAAWAAAREAARAAAWEAAWAAAGEAARGEMRQWQTEKLIALLFK